MTRARLTVKVRPVHPFPSLLILVRLDLLILGDPGVRLPTSLGPDIPRPTQQLLGLPIFSDEDQRPRMTEDGLLSMYRASETDWSGRTEGGGFGLVERKDRFKGRPEDEDLSRGRAS